MAGCKTCCDDVPQQVLIERILKSLLRKMIQDGDLQSGLNNCDGLALPKSTQVPSCTDVTQMIQKALRDAAGGNGPNDIRGQIIDVINGLILDGTLSPGLQTCDGAALGKGAKIATCADLDCAQFKCGGNNGGGTNPVDKYLTNVIIDEAAKTMTFKVKGQPDIVIDVTKFLEDLNDYVTNAIVDNAAKTITLKVKNQNDVVIELEEMLQGLGGGDDTYHTVKQPTFNNDTRVLTIPQERFRNGTSQGVDNWEITIPATGNAPGGADNDTKTARLEFVETNDNGRKVKVKLTDTAGGTFETADLELPAAGGPDNDTKITKIERVYTPWQSVSKPSMVHFKITDSAGDTFESGKLFASAMAGIRPHWDFTKPLTDTPVNSPVNSRFNVYANWQSINATGDPVTTPWLGEDADMPYEWTTSVEFAPDTKELKITQLRGAPTDKTPVEGEKVWTVDLSSLAAGGGGAENVALTREEKDFSGIYNNLFRNEANVYEYTFTNAAGQQQKFKEVIGRPIALKYVVETGGNYGLAKHQIEHYRLIDEGQGTKGELDLAHAALGTPRLEGTVLKINMHHRQYEEKVGGSDQEVSVDLAALAGGGGAPTPPNVGGNAKPASNDDTKLPTKLYGTRTALLGEPDAWEEVVASDGNTYLRPLWRKQ